MKTTGDSLVRSRRADHSSEKHPDGCQRRWSRDLFQIRSTFESSSLGEPSRHQLAIPAGRDSKPAFLTTRRSKHAIRPPGLRYACLPCSTYCASTPARAKRLAPFCSARLAPRPDGPLTHFASPRGEKCRLVKALKSLIRDPHGLLIATWRDMQARFFPLVGGTFKQETSGWVSTRLDKQDVPGQVLSCRAGWKYCRFSSSYGS